MMRYPVLAIALDSAEPSLIERWIDEGRLPTLRRLRELGAYGRTSSPDVQFPELAWTNFLTGVGPRKTGYYSPFRYDPGAYRVDTVGAYDYRDYPPFYALGDDYRVAIFDVPQTAFSDHVNGVQVLGWGAHAAWAPSAARPKHLWREIIAKHGRHPGFERDHARLWRKDSMARLQRRLLAGLKRRVRIATDLLKRERWDLFLTVFSETHSCGHFLWHVSQADHPLYPFYRNILGRDPLLEIFQAADRGVASLIAAAPPDTRVMVFSVHGMEANKSDLPSMFFMPELMYRFGFPGRCGFTESQPGDNAPPPDMITHPHSLGWVREVWERRTDPNPARKFLRKSLLMELSHAVEAILGTSEGPDYPYNFNPHHFVASWYSPFWSRMPAFALPSEGADGYIRVNLKGRESRGIVDPSDYAALCNRLTAHLLELRNARNGAPIVAEVVRTRRNPTDESDNPCEADLLVRWRDDGPFDVIDSPTFGRIGPVPFRRSGGHTFNGFVSISGPGIPSGETLPSGHAFDITPTVLRLMGAPLLSYFEGRPLFDPSGDGGHTLSPAGMVARV